MKIQSGHDSVHRRTDGQTDKVIPVYPPFNFVEAGGITTDRWTDITGHKMRPMDTQKTEGKQTDSANLDNTIQIFKMRG